MADKDKDKDKQKKAVPSHDKANEPARYADSVIVYSTKRQFLIDFNQSMPGADKLLNVGRVVLHPKTAGELLSALLQQVAKHEEENKDGILPPGFKFEMVARKTDVH